MKKVVIIIAAIALLAASITIPKSTAADSNEMKGLWVATAWRLNYPSAYTGDAETLKRDARAILNNAEQMGYNTVFLQVVPSADAFYQSDILPWSKFITGTQGGAPSGGFDPLEYFVEQAHNRGIELHAWLNPYRVTSSATDQLVASHPASQNPAWTVNSGNLLYWNPGIPEVQSLIKSTAQEIVDNYDVDGLHIDDYFYPSGSFDDAETFTTYGQDYGNIGDWRRSNTETTVRNLQSVAKNAGVKFGVSPFGIWANKASNSLGSNTNGNQSYSVMYADTRKWVKNELVDYIAPQIYWEFSHSLAPYGTLVDWWSDIVSGTNVELYIGMAAYRCEPNASPKWSVNEIKRQVEYNRTKSEVDGYIMYSSRAFTLNKDLKELITKLNNVKFPDVIGHWAESAIFSLSERGIVNGATDGNFYPKDNIKRADYVLMLLAMLDIEPQTGLANFDDVRSSKYYANAIATAKSLGLIEGIGNNNFAPDDTITRQDLFKMTYQALRVLNLGLDANDDSALDKFIDNASIAGYARLPLASLAQNGLINGSDGKINPTGQASRGETAQVMYNIISSLNI